MANVMQMTRGCEYAIRAVSYIASRDAGTVVPTELISAQAEIPRNFASNVLGHLARAGLLSAHRGSTSGYSLSRPASEITVLDVIEAYDGPFVKPWCLLNSDARCSESSPCAMHSSWQALASGARDLLLKISIADIAANPPQLISSTPPTQEAR